MDFADSIFHFPNFALSHLKTLRRLVGMSGDTRAKWIWMAGVVLAHLGISMIHGVAHANARVPLSPAMSVFVYTVILAGPLIGLALTWPLRRVGAAVIAFTMLGSLLFGFLNHLVFAGPDHVAHVDLQWRSLFATTAVLLALTEAMGFGLAVRLLRERSLL
jgi:hypothetical protein